MLMLASGSTREQQNPISPSPTPLFDLGIHNAYNE
jgi:hypothetical protein